MQRALHTVTWIPMKPTFSASKVAALVNLNPFEKVFDTIYDTMAKHDIPMETFEVDDRQVNIGEAHLAGKQVLEKHLSELVQPHITCKTTASELNLLQQTLSILGPVGQQAASFARLRYGQLQESRVVDVLKSQGNYRKSQQKTVEFKHFYLTGKTDGTFDDVIVEIKNRTRRFLGVTDYERPQFECYMRLFNVNEMYLCENFDNEERKILLFANDELWELIVKRLTWVAQFMEEVQQQPYLQQLSKEELEFQFHRFIAERIIVDIESTFSTK